MWRGQPTSPLQSCSNCFLAPDLNSEYQTLAHKNVVLIRKIRLKCCRPPADLTRSILRMRRWWLRLFPFFSLFCNTSSFQKGIILWTAFTEVYKCTNLTAVSDCLFCLIGCFILEHSEWETSLLLGGCGKGIQRLSGGLNHQRFQTHGSCVLETLLVSRWRKTVVNFLSVDSMKSSAGTSFQNSKNCRICIQFPSSTQFSETRHLYLI